MSADLYQEISDFAMQLLRVFHGDSAVVFFLILWALLLLSNTVAAGCYKGLAKQTAYRQRMLKNHRLLAANQSSTWNTSDGSMPLIIANGGSSGLLPDQTMLAYNLASISSLPGVAVFCDLQLTNDSASLCRTGIDLGQSTNINFSSLANKTNQYSVNGKIIKGFFSVDLSKQDLPKIQATQSNTARAPYYDGIFPILQLQNASDFAVQSQSPLWVNVEYYSFFKEHGLDIASYLATILTKHTLPVSYISSPERAFLKAVQAAAPKNLPKLIFKFLAKQDVELSTNATYGLLVSNLTSIATFASGILVPKDYIWPVDSTTAYLMAETSLIQDARNAGLLVYVSNFVNDEVNNVYAPIYNYSFDPIREYLQYVPSTGPIVDGFLTDFPVTASEALACYTTISSSKEAAMNTTPLVISHNGASGDYPGCTLLAYEGAVGDGASFIDCPIQVTMDGIPICRESHDLIPNTNVALHSKFYPSRFTKISELQSTPGIFTFNMTWEEISTLKARMYSPEQVTYNISRNPAFIEESIIAFSDFLDYAKNHTNVGIFIHIQNGYFLETQVNLDVVGLVLSVLEGAGLKDSNRVTIQSEDSAVLQRLRQLSSYQLAYRVVNESVSITQSEVDAIHALAPIVTLPRHLILESTPTSLLLNATSVVDLFHKNNMSVFVSYLRNEFVVLSFDFEADPTLELNTLIQILGVDGVITDFPATARAYLNNACRLNREPSGLNYSMFVVVPGDLLYQVPSQVPPPQTDPVYPPLNISANEGALPPTVIAPVSPKLPSPPSSKSGPGSGPSPSPLPSIGSRSLAIPGVLVLLRALFSYVCLSL